MKTTRGSLCALLCAGLLTVGSSSGCHSMNKTEKGALIGSGAGAALGAIIGHQTGNKEIGALIGALGGAAAGGLAGKAADNADARDAANARAYRAEQQHRASLKAVTNYDVVTMTQSGLSDSMIIATIRDRGGRFDMSPSQIIYLNQQGVSETVMQAMQQYNRAR